MFKGKKDEVAWRGIDVIKNKKKQGPMCIHSF